MTVSNTSIDAYHKLETNGKLSEDQIKVYKALIDLGEASDTMIASYLGELDAINSKKYRPRRSELVDLGLVKACFKRPCVLTGNTVTFWEINNGGVVKSEKVALSDLMFRKLMSLLDDTNFFQRQMIRRRLKSFGDVEVQEVLG